MTSRSLCGIVLSVLLLAAVACTNDPITPTVTTPTVQTPPPAPAISIGTPTLQQPPAGATSFGWPTFTWDNATKTNTSNALLYRFDLSTTADFGTVAYTTTVGEGSGQTSFTPPATQAAPAEGSLYWRVVAVDQANAVQSQPSAAGSFKYYEDTWQNRVAVQLYGSLWTNARPTGPRGRARTGPGWNVSTRRSFDGVTFQSPPLEVLRIYDLLDTGMSPDGAIGWMRSNGYPSVAVWYPSVASIGFPFQYMALIRGEWELVHRVGA